MLTRGEVVHEVILECMDDGFMSTQAALMNNNEAGRAAAIDRQAARRGSIRHSLLACWHPAAASISA
jgi:hypothetical protein